MGSLDSTQTAIEKPQLAAEKNAGGSLVDMSDQKEMRSVFPLSDSRGQSVVSNSGQLMFDNPYLAAGAQDTRFPTPTKELGDSVPSALPAGNQEASLLGLEAGLLSAEAGILQGELSVLGQIAQGEQPVSAAASTESPLDQQIQTQLLQIAQDFGQLASDVSQLFAPAADLPASAPAMQTPTDVSTTSAPTEASTTSAPTENSTTSAPAESSLPPVTTPTDTTVAATTPAITETSPPAAISTPDTTNPTTTTPSAPDTTNPTTTTPNDSTAVSSSTSPPAGNLTSAELLAIANKDFPVQSNGHYDAAAWASQHNNNVAKATAAAQAGSQIEFFGDSITAGMSSNISVMDKNFSQDDPTAMGITSDTSAALLWRVNHGEFQGTPKVAVVMIGTNDLSGSTPSQIETNVSETIQTIQDKSPDTKVLLMGILPRPADGDPGNKSVDAANAALSKLATPDGSVVFDNIDSQFLTASGTEISSLYNTDGLHPNAAGDQVWANAITPMLDQMLGTAS